jgi:hypothetical protein
LELSTEKFLRKNLLKTFQASESPDSTHLLEALAKLTKFVNACQRSTRAKFPSSLGELGVWGNGVIADNVWIRSAYKACNMRRPWKDFSDMCVRTFVEQGTLMTGIDRKNLTKFTGVPHKALDDCRHQIKYLVPTRNDLLQPEDASGEESNSIEDIAQPSVPSACATVTSERPIEQISAENAARVPAAARPFLTPEPSFSGETLASKDAAVPVPVAPKFLPTPEASLTEVESGLDTVVKGPPSKKLRLSLGVTGS